MRSASLQLQTELHRLHAPLGLAAQSAGLFLLLSGTLTHHLLLVAFDDPMRLCVELLTLCLEDLLADLCMLLIRFGVKAAAAASALDQALWHVVVLVKRLRLELVHRPVVDVLIHRCLVRRRLHTWPFCDADTTALLRAGVPLSHLALEQTELRLYHLLLLGEVAQSAPALHRYFGLHRTLQVYIMEVRRFHVLALFLQTRLRCLEWLLVVDYLASFGGALT